MTQRRRHDAIALAALTFLIALLFADVLLGLGSLFVRDLAFYYYPAKHVLREIVLGGEFPFWNPYFSAGQPMAANPEHEVFYPLTWLILLPSYDFGFRLLVVLHLWIAAWSMYALLRSMRLRAVTAFLGALSFAIGGMMGSLLALLPYLFILAWLPLTCLYARRYLLFRKRRDLALATFFLGLQVIIGEPTTVFQSGLLLGMFAIWFGWRRKQVLRSVAAIGVMTIGALLLSAVQTLPVIDHARDSVRASGFSFELVSLFSMPPAKPIEWLVAELPGNDPSLYPGRGYPYVKSIYLGLAIAVPALAGLFARVRGWGLVLAAMLVSIVVALGANTPLLRVLYDLGVASSIRYPEKFILLGTFALVVFGAVVLDRMLRGDRRVRNIAMVIAVLAAVIAIPEPFAAIKAVLLLVLLRNIDTRAAIPLLTAFVLLDLAMLVPKVAPRISPAFYREAPPAIAQLPPQRHLYRVLDKATWDGTPAPYQTYFTDPRDRSWLTRNALYPVIPTLFGLRTVMEKDYDLTALQVTEDFTAAMFELAKYRDDWAVVACSMSNAWFGTGWAPPAEAYAKANGEAERIQPLRLIGVPRFPRYYFARHVESVRDRADFVRKLGSRRFGPATAFVREQGFAPAHGAVLRVAERANAARIEVETNGRAFLVMSVTPHKYWTVTIDGAEAPAVVTNIGYQGVVIPAAGRHVVEMRYRNPLVLAGGAVSLATLLALILLARRRR